MLDEIPGDQRIDLGNNVWATKVVLSDDTWAGIHIWHRCIDPHDGVERWDGGYVAFDLPCRTVKPVWAVNSYDPLDISPSVLHNECGFHGFIRNGKWESC